MTLIEVLLAVAILSLGLVMMLTAISRCLGVLKISEQYQKAMQALSEGEVKYPIVTGMKPDDMDVPAEDFNGILFERRAEDPDKDNPDYEQRLLVITTTLSWEGRGKQQLEEVKRYIYYRDPI